MEGFYSSHKTEEFIWFWGTLSQNWTRLYGF